MNAMEQLVALVALLRNSPRKRFRMELRQLLVDGVEPIEIAADEHISRSALKDSEQLVDRWLAAGERPLSWLDDDYPQQLRDVHDFPPVIFVRGQIQENDRGICVVGSRTAGPAAEEAAREVATQLVAEKLTVVGGLARGIDTAAHRAALDQSGRTVAVIGCGIDQYYPAENRGLQRAIERSGMVLSQFWPGMRPTKFTFPMRNAVMSAYAQATIIIAAEESSGTRHQARQAVAHGRPLVLSRSVANNTSWGRALASDQTLMVEVAHSPSAAVELAKQMADDMCSELV